MKRNYIITTVYCFAILCTILYLCYDWQARFELFQSLLSAAILTTALLLTRIRENELVRAALVTLTGFAAIRVFVWRVGCTLNLTSPFNALATIMLLVGECFAIFGFFLIALQNWDLTRRPKIESDGSYSPSVDVFVTTYNESIEIIRRTLCGANYIDYPNKRVYVLDDGRRSEVMELALAMNVGYITRPNNKHAKAGNINNALKQTNGEFVLILDADHIPCKTILKCMIPYFKDEKVGFVQTAHRFVNRAPIQRNLHIEGQLPHEQELFFQVSMVGKDHWNAAIFAGSAGTIRRSVLEKLGGMSIRTVIEDCEFSLEMHRQGYKSVYVPEAQCIGMCPETLEAYLIQQSRWARGQTQMLVVTNPLVGPGLTIAQRMCYLANNLYYLFGIPRIIYIVIPVLFLVLGVCGISVSWLEYSLMTLPFLFNWLLTQSYINKNFRHSFWSDVYEVILAPFVTHWTTTTLLDPRVARFRVTPKGIRTPQFFLDVRLVWSHLLLLVICCLAFMIGVLKLVLRFDPMGNMANLVWDAYNIIILSCAVMVGFERKQLRRAHRVKRSIPVTAQISSPSPNIVSGLTQDISEYGARLRVLAPELKLQKDDKIIISLQTDEGDLIDVYSRLVRMVQESQFCILEVEFLKPDPALLERLIHVSYCSPTTWESIEEPKDSLLSSFIEVVQTPIRVLREIHRNFDWASLAIIVPQPVFVSRFVPDKLRPLLMVEEGVPATSVTGSIDRRNEYDDARMQENVSYEKAD